MNITPTISILEVVLLLVGLLAAVTALDNAIRALADGANLRRGNMNGSRRRTANWSARNEIQIVVAALILALRIIADMTLSPYEGGEGEFAHTFIDWISMVLGLLYLTVATWNKYDRRRLVADYSREIKQTEDAVADALATQPSTDGSYERQVQAEAIVEGIHSVPPHDAEIKE